MGWGAVGRAEQWGPGGPLGQQVGKESARLRIAFGRSKVPTPDPAGRGELSIGLSREYTPLVP